MLVKSKIRKNDTVEVIAGKDKGKRGEVVRVDLKKERVVVSGVNIVKKAMKKATRKFAFAVNVEMFCNGKLRTSA